MRNEDDRQVEAGKAKAVGPRGTLRLVSGEEAESGPVLIDDAPTPVDPPSFDLAALAREAVEMPTHAPPPAATASVALPTAGQPFLSYLVLGEHARGGLSLLYELSHATTRERAVLKLLRPEYRHATIHHDRLIAEGKLLKSASSHPGLVKVYEVGTDSAFGAYFVMELLKGSTIREVIRRENAQGRTLPLKASVNIAISAAEVLQAMHEQGAVHRDIKPDNIFLVRHGDGQQTVKVIDFGAGKHRFSPRSTHVPAVLTPLYMAPEQATGNRAATGAIDQYALAFVLLEMVWEHPFAAAMQRQGGMLHELIGMHVHEPLPVPPAHLVPAPLFAILQRATAKRPEERFGSIGELADALRSFLEGGYELAKKPSSLDLPFRPTVLTERAKKHTPDAPAVAERRVPLNPPVPVRRFELGEVSKRATMLVLAPESLRGARFDIGASGVIGRHPGMCNLVLDHPTVSNEHLLYSCVQLDGERPVYSIENLAQNNPPFLSGAPVEVAPWLPNQILELGEVRLCLVPAGRVEPDLSNVVPLRDMAASGGEEAPPSKGTGRRQRRVIPLEVSWPRPSFLITKPSHLAGQRIDLGAHGVFGRGPEQSDVVLEDDSVSQAHAEYTLVTSGKRRIDRTVYELVDLGSTNGTYLVEPNGELVRVDAHYVTAFRRLRLGDLVGAILPPGRPRRGDVDDWEYLDQAKPLGSGTMKVAPVGRSSLWRRLDRGTRAAVVFIVVLVPVFVALLVGVLRQRGALP